MSDNITRCPRCGNILAVRNNILYCAYCEKLLKAYCKRFGVEYEIARRILADDSDHVSWRWKKPYGKEDKWDIVVTGGESLSKKFQKRLGL